MKRSFLRWLYEGLFLINKSETDKNLLFFIILLFSGIITVFVGFGLVASYLNMPWLIPLPVIGGIFLIAYGIYILDER